MLTEEEYAKLQKDDPEAAARLQRNNNLTPEQKKNKKIGRNDPCPCGSGKKFKNCCSFKQKDKELHNPNLDPPKQRIRSFFNISSFENPKKELICLKKYTHEGTDVFVMQYKHMFQYMFSKNDRMYIDHFFLRPPFIRKLLSFVGINLYSKDELDYGIKVALNAAGRSIDEINLKKPIKADPIPLEK